ncbi:MAG: hypothetical protein NUV81_01375 [bacterium]|nr:hypothetical protein [bacterium]
MIFLLATACGGIAIIDGDPSSTSKSTTTSSSTSTQTSSGGMGGMPDVPPAGCPDKALDIQLSSITPKSRILVAGKGWEEVARYTVSADGVDRKIVYAEISQIHPEGDVADFSEVALGAGGAILLFGSKVEGSTFILSGGMGENIVIPAGTSATMEMWAKVAPVKSSASAGGKWHGVSRSGHSPVLALSSYRLQTDESEVLRPVCTSDPSPMVVRKSKPIIKKLQLASNSLKPGSIDFFSWAISSDPVANIDATLSVAIHQIAFHVEKKGGFGVQKLRLKKDAQDVPLGTYDVLVCSDDFVCNGSMVESSFTAGNVFISWKIEELVSPKVSEYTLSGDVLDAKEGDAITLSFLRTDPKSDPLLDPLVTTGKVTRGESPLFFIPKDGLEFDGEPYLPYSGARPYFLWSDLSEVPHHDETGFLDSSVDWTADLLVEDLVGTETLTY